MRARAQVWCRLVGRPPATNKEKQEAFLARKKKLAEKNKATPTKPTKSIRRGKHGGLREIERKTLKENMN